MSYTQPLVSEIKTALEDLRRHLDWQASEGGDVILSVPASRSASESPVAAPPAARPSSPAPNVDSTQFALSLGSAAVGRDPFQSGRAGAATIENEHRTLEEIRADLGDCRRCKLCQGRTNIVFGVGNPKAKLVFVGEGPGADEDAQGIPFVGKAGQLLTKMIEAMGFSREDVYICNVIKCRPPGNRNPEPDEIAACQPFLRAQLGAIRPKAIVALGKVAVQTLLRDQTPITRIRGNWREYCGIRLMPTFHPAYLLRNPAEKRNAWSDLQQVMKFFGKEMRNR